MINEIMYAPLTGRAEFLELLNVSTADIDVNGWTFSERPTSGGTMNSYMVATSSRIVHPGDHFIIGSDSSLLRQFPHLIEAESRLISIANKTSLTLNNSGDDVVLRDLLGMPIDSVAYSPSWHNPGITDNTGRSLEKINPLLGSNDGRNWSTCIRPTGGTPGLVNSIYTTSLPSYSSLSFSPNPFSPDGDGVEDFTVIHYELPIQVSVISMKVFDVKGRLIRTLANNEPGTSRSDLVWDGLDDEKQKVRIGPYIILLEAINESGAVLESVKGVTVVAGRLR
jgi:hypothetical protein